MKETKKLFKKTNCKVDTKKVRLYNAPEGNNCKCNNKKDNCSCGYSN
ncbi:MAG: hypothetical protein IJX51_01665 [Clostridia bacterium]|nr:hypothetical protein [Clostridia bacterium]